jgi:hypothetical protein
MSTAPTAVSEILARIWHSDLHFTAHGYIQPHTRSTGKITKARITAGHRPLSAVFECGAAGTRTQDRRIMSPLL